MGTLSHLRTDLDLEKEGAWEVFEGIRFKIAYLKHGLDAEVEKLGPAFKMKLRDERLSEAEAERLLLSVLGDHVVTDWEDLTEDDQETPIPYSSEKCREMLADPASEIWRQWVLEKSKDRRRFLQHLREDALGN